MPKKLVRYTRDYSLLVDAPTDEAAIEKAESAPVDEWDVTESTFEVENVDVVSNSSCAHQGHEDHMLCRICGRCGESLNDDDVCRECAVFPTE